MELLDRYLHAVSFWLPKAQKKDIVSELSEDIRSEAEEKERELGRSLSDEEMAAILKRRGRPFAVAQRYLPQRHLIGPVLFPVYLFVLKLVALLYLVPWLIVWAAFVIFVPSYRAQHPGLEILKTLGTLWQISLYAFAVITIVFAVADRARSRGEGETTWDPRRLPRVRDTRRIPRSSAIGDIVFGVLFLLFWLGTLSFREAFGGATTPAGLTMGPAWQSFRQEYYVPIAALTLVGVALAVANLIRPHWSRLRLGIRAAINASSAAILAVVLVRHWTEVKAQWLQLIAHKTGAPGIETVQGWVNISVFAGLAIADVICTVECVRDIRRLLSLKSDAIARENNS